ncbi:hypothetical protein H4R34_003513 [Dimargaris verticillata]|uniref:Pentatricopeptide repeat-containing protein n=1 Tax=Dimargaris verticillata TaxID=2761393 RepID=A0A9W8ED31_9FUNG|nr:hypothetical protein H4R34_003513 [Dimargaris verticillata]
MSALFLRLARSAAAKPGLRVPAVSNTRALRATGAVGARTMASISQFTPPALPDYHCHGQPALVVPPALSSQLLADLRLAIWQLKSDTVWEIYMLLAERQQLQFLSARDHYNVFNSYSLRVFQGKHRTADSQVLDRVKFTWQNLHQYNHAPGLREYNHLLGFLSHQHDIDGIESMLREMQENGVEPDSYTHCVRFHAYAKLGQTDKAFAALEQLQQLNRIPYSYIKVALIELYGMIGRPTMAHAIYNQERTPASLQGVRVDTINVHITNAMLRALGRNGLLQEMRTVFTNAWLQGGRNGLNYISFEQMIRWHACHQRFDLAKQYFEVMQLEPFEFKATPRTFRLLVPPNALSTHGEYSRDMIHRMTDEYKFQPLDYMLDAVAEIFPQTEASLTDQESPISAFDNYDADKPDQPNLASDPAPFAAA